MKFTRSGDPYMKLGLGRYSSQYRRRILSQAWGFFVEHCTFDDKTWSHLLPGWFYKQSLLPTDGEIDQYKRIVEKTRRGETLPRDLRSI